MIYNFHSIFLGYSQHLSQTQPNRPNVYQPSYQRMETDPVSDILCRHFVFLKNLDNK